MQSKGLLKAQISGLHLQSFSSSIPGDVKFQISAFFPGGHSDDHGWGRYNFNVLRWAEEFSLLTNFQMMVMLLVWGLHLEPLTYTSNVSSMRAEIIFDLFTKVLGVL